MVEAIQEGYSLEIKFVKVYVCRGVGEEGALI